MIDLSVPEFLQSRGPPDRASGRAHMHTRVHASGDEGLDLQAFPVPAVLVVPIDIVRSEASGVPQGEGGLILRGLFDPREDVARGKFTDSQSFV